MGARTKRFAKHVISLLLVQSMSVLAPEQFGMAQTSQAPQPTGWKVRYEAGPWSIPRGTKLTVTCNEERIVGEGKRARFSIPVAGMLDVSTNSRARYPMWDAQAKAWTAWATATGGYGLVFFPFGVPLLLAAIGVKSRDYLLDVIWKEGGVEQNVLLAIDKDHYSPFLSELNRVTGKEWKNLDAEWQKIEREIRQEQGNSISLRLDRTVHVAGTELKPGTYQAVFLPRQGNLGELYFFKGHAVDTARIATLTAVTLGFAIGEADLTQKEVATTARAEVEAQPSTVSTAEVSYIEKGGLVTISEIRTRKKIFRLPP